MSYELHKTEEDTSNNVFPKHLSRGYNKCYYTDKETNGKSVILPYDESQGISCCDEKIMVAKKQIYDYCIKNNIFPVNRNVIDLLNVKTVRVKRTNGDIEDDWEIGNWKSTLEKDGQVYIGVINRRINGERYVPLKELCAMNNLNYETFDNLLREELKRMYLTDCQLDCENMKLLKVKKKWPIVDYVWQRLKLISA